MLVSIAVFMIAVGFFAAAITRVRQSWPAFLLLTASILVSYQHLIQIRIFFLDLFVAFFFAAITFAPFLLLVILLITRRK